MFRVPKDTAMTPELLAKYINKHKNLVNTRLRKLQDAYENKYDIFKADKKAAYKPDNRISVNHAKFIVDTFNGFFMGVPIKITSTSPDTKKNQKINEFIEYIDRLNSLDNKNRELAKLSDILGASNEIYFANEEGDLGIMHLSRLESFFIYDDSILKRPMYFIRYFKDSNGIERGSWSDKYVVQYFVHDGVYKWVDEPQPHLFADVPATEFPENAERRGLFESELSAMNEYNKALSEKANDVDYFADAYLKIIGPHVDDEDTTHMRSNRVINFEGDEGNRPEVDFIMKPSADTTQENLLERLKADIFQTAMVPDINDSNFGSVSGVALKYRLLSMSNMAKVKTGLFKEALSRRYKLLFSHPRADAFEVSRDDWVNLDYHFTENYPANVSDETEIARNLTGVVSKETQLKVLSIVDDVSAEMIRMDEEQNAQEESIIEKRMFSKGDVNE